MWTRRSQSFGLTILHMLWAVFTGGSSVLQYLNKRCLLFCPFYVSTFFRGKITEWHFELLNLSRLSKLKKFMFLSSYFGLHSRYMSIFRHLFMTIIMFFSNFGSCIDPCIDRKLLLAYFLWTELDIVYGFDWTALVSHDPINTIVVDWNKNGLDASLRNKEGIML